MGSWAKVERVLSWAEHIQFLWGILALGLGAVVRAIVAARIPDIWLTPVWFLSSAVFLFILSAIARKLIKPQRQQRSGRSRACLKYSQHPRRLYLIGNHF